MIDLVQLVKTNNLLDLEQYLTLINVNTIDGWGDSLLHLAIRSGNITIIKLLMKFNPKLDIVNTSHESILETLYDIKNKKIIKLLIPYFNMELSIYDLTYMHKLTKICTFELSATFITNNIDNIISYGYSDMIPENIKSIFLF